MGSRTENAHAEQVKCINCGATDFEWGWVHNRGAIHYELFSQMDEGWILGQRGRAVKSRRCLRCNHIALFCDPQFHRLIRLPRFSLRSLLIGMTLIAVLLGAVIYAAK